MVKPQKKVEDTVSVASLEGRERLGRRRAQRAWVQTDLVGRLVRANLVLWWELDFKQAVGSEVRSEVRSEVGSEVRSEVRSDVRSEVRSEVRKTDLFAR